MSDSSQAITVANDQSMIALIRGAHQRVVVLAPAVTTPVAQAIAERWVELGRDEISVILDVDAEVYRLGYGDPEALRLLEKTAANLGTTLNRQPRIRIGLVIADDQTMVFAPTPRLIEAGPEADPASPDPPAPNAVLLGMAPPAVEAELGVGERGVLDQKVGLDKAEKAKINEVEADLEKNPPQRFDIARQVRVFNAAFEFVEFELKGTSISRKTVPIPKHLSGVADDATREQLTTSFKILPPDHALSGKPLEHDKQLITKQFLRQIQGYGTVVMRSRKDAFLAEVARLQESVKDFGAKIREQLQQAMDETREKLVESMFPLVQQTTPKEWIRSDGSKPDDEGLRTLLDIDLRQAFGTADRLIKHMEVRLVFKGVTYESLMSDEFMKAARDALPELSNLYSEFDAARGRPETTESTDQ